MIDQTKTPPLNVDKVNDDSLPDEEVLFSWLTLLNDLVWNDNLKRQNIEKWLSNFKGEVFDPDYERQLALWLLANFVYYNEKEVRHLCRTIFREYLREMLTGKKEAGDINSLIDKIINETKFLNLGIPGESGSLILYFFRQENNLNKCSMDLTENRDSIKNIVYIDDASISGSTAIQYITQQKRLFEEDYKIYLLTFIATNRSIVELELIGVKVISAIILDDRDKCFSENSNLFYKRNDKLEDCKNFAIHYGEKCVYNHAFTIHPLGYLEGEYSFGFFHNIPDGTLPIFWSTNNGWIPILKRHEKINGGGFDEPYI